MSQLTKCYTLYIRSSGDGRCTPMRVAMVMFRELGITVPKEGFVPTEDPETGLRHCTLSVSGAYSRDAIITALLTNGFIYDDVVIYDPSEADINYYNLEYPESIEAAE